MSKSISQFIRENTSKSIRQFIRENLIKTLNEAKENHKFEYGALMLDIQYSGWEKILSLIDKEDIYDEEPGFGLEKEPHVTVLFGFENDSDFKKIKEKVKENQDGPVNIIVQNITHFETPDYDVIKFDVKSKDLVEDISVD